MRTMGESQYTTLSQALGETIDNSIQGVFASELANYYKAHSRQPKPPVIDITVNERQIKVVDNGVGSKDIAALAQISEHQRVKVVSRADSRGRKHVRSQSIRKVLASTMLSDANLTGDFSRYGIGAKAGAAFLGKRFKATSTYVGSTVTKWMQWNAVCIKSQCLFDDCFTVVVEKMCDADAWCGVCRPRRRGMDMSGMPQKELGMPGANSLTVQRRRSGSLRGKFPKILSRSSERIFSGCTTSIYADSAAFWSW